MAQHKPLMTMADFASSIIDLDDARPSANILLYSDAGLGKTALASALPNSILLGFDPGWATAKALGRKCRLSVIDNHEKLLGGLAWLEDSGFTEYEWVIADGCSILQEKLRQQYTREAWEANPEKRVSPWQPDKPDYGKEQSVFKSVIGRLCDLPTNVVFTFHASRGNDADSEEWIRPQVAGREYNVGNFVTGLMSCIGYFAERSIQEGKTKRQVRRLLWNSYVDSDRGLTIMAKDQINAFPRFMDDPTADEIHKLVSGKIGTELPAPDAPAPARKRVPRPASERLTTRGPR